MPADYVITTADMIQITMTPPTVVPQLLAPIPLIGTSTSVAIKGKFICLKGDELPPVISGPMPYVFGPFTIPGAGTLQIMLSPANFTMATKNGRPILIKGPTFPVQFQVTVPAQAPPPASTPDGVLMKPGTGQFLTTNLVVKAG